MKKVLLFFAVAILWLPQAVSAQNLEDLLTDKKIELKEIQKKIDEQEKLLSAKRKEVLSLSRQVDLLDRQIEATQLELARLDTRVEALQLETRLTNRRLVDTEEKVLDNKLVLREVLQASYEQRRLGTFEILLTATTFSDFMTRLEYIRTVEEKVTELISQMAGLIKSLRERKGQLAGIVEEVKTLKLERELEENSLSIQIAGKANLLKTTKNKESEYAKQLELSRQEELEASREISSLLSSLGRRRAPVGEKKVAWPIAARGISAGFRDPDYRRVFGFEHNGIDIPTPHGTPVRAAADGVVIKIKDGGPRGLSYLVINHDNGLTTVYMHLSGFSVANGAYLVEGQVIGFSGGTPGTPGAGLTTGPHLHLEVWDEGQPKNPLSYLI